METRELVKELARKMVEKPDAVSVSEFEGEQVIVIELKVDKGDVGKGDRKRRKDCLRR